MLTWIAFYTLFYFKLTNQAVFTIYPPKWNINGNLTQCGLTSTAYIFFLSGSVTRFFEFFFSMIEPIWAADKQGKMVSLKNEKEFLREPYPLTPK